MTADASVNRQETDTEAAIVAEGLTREFGETVAVDSLDLAVPEGSVYGFLGPNGAGKTTTIEMLTTLLPPTAGRARVAGVSVTDRDGVKEHIGYLPHESPVYESFTAREQLAYAADLHRLDADRADERIERLLSRVDLLADEVYHRTGGPRVESAGRLVEKGHLGVVQQCLHQPHLPAHPL